MKNEICDIKNVSGYTQNFRATRIYRGTDGLWHVSEFCNRIRVFFCDSFCHGNICRIQRASDHAAHPVSIPHGIFLTTLRPVQLASIFPKSTSSADPLAKSAIFAKTGPVTGSPCGNGAASSVFGHTYLVGTLGGSQPHVVYHVLRGARIVCSIQYAMHTPRRYTGVLPA